MGPAKHWAPLFVWLQSHIAEMLEKSRVHLSQKSGVTWRMNAEPPSQPPRIIVVDQER
ncbi:hypothetical protein METY_0063 [Methylopila sp. Yamaguchi]|nr:hypothetical protein METY_0063 [Methylopila sp. Yamaguchi]